jgi:hypothetical protein
MPEAGRFARILLLTAFKLVSIVTTNDCGIGDGYSSVTSPSSQGLIPLGSGGVGGGSVSGAFIASDSLTLNLGTIATGDRYISRKPSLLFYRLPASRSSTSMKVAPAHSPFFLWLIEHLI